MGELGDGGAELSKVLRNGPPMLINQGKFPTSFTVNGQTHRFIVISPQFSAWPARSDVNSILNYVLQNYKVNENRVYMTGLSMGGGVTWEYAGGTSPVYAYRLAGIVPVCGASWPEPTRAKTIANNSVPVWATHNNGDGTVPVWYTDNYVKYINENVPAPQVPAKKTIFTSTSHDAWSRTYDPNFREGGLNVYEWLLQYERGANLPPVPNQLPAVNIGADRIISLPTNSIQVTGTASDADGSIVSYRWTKTSGPEQYSFSNATGVNTTISNLAAGNYTFRLTATDNKGAAGYDEINVIVNAAAPAGSYRVLIDLGATTISGADQWGNYWNNITDARPGVRLSNAKTTANVSSGIGLEVINRLNGNWEASGTALGAGNTVGVVGDYPANATVDYAIAHNTTTAGVWKLIGLDPAKTYRVKFWGTRNNTTGTRIIQIKRSTETAWKEYDAVNNTDYSRAAIFENITGLTEVSFNFQVKSGSQFGNISLLDIMVSPNSTQPPANQSPVANAGSDKTLTLPASSIQLSGSGTDTDGTIASYSWTKISGPAYAISNAGIASPALSGLVAGTYVFQLKVTDDKGATGTDDVTITVNSGSSTPVVAQRVLIDIGPANTSSPDASGKYWNMMTDGRTGVRVANARSTENTATGINLEVVNRINGTWDVAGTGLNTGNSVGAVGEYPATSTTDFAIAHSSTSSGQWKLSGLDPAKTYKIKFWGARTSSGTRIIQIKRSTETAWKEYDAVNNTDFNRAAIFENITGITEASFDIRVKSGQTFGHINVIDITIAGDDGVSASSATTPPAAIEEFTGRLENISSNNGIAVFPSPVQEKFTLQINSSNTGLAKVLILDMNGAVRKELRVKKDQSQPQQISMSAAGLAAGTYIIKVQIGAWSGSQKLIKL